MAFFTKKRPPLNDVPAFESFYAVLCGAAAQSGDTIAVKYKTRGAQHDVTYTELLSKVNSLRAGLSALPEVPKRAAILCPNGFPFIASLLTLLSCGCVIVPLDAELPFFENINILNHSDCDTLFFDKSFLDAVNEHKKSLPKIVNYVCAGLKEHEESDGLYSYAALLERGLNVLSETEEELSFECPPDDETALLCYKSGSTDSLFGVCLTAGALKTAVRGFLQMTELSGRCLSVQPFDRPFELICGLLASFCSRATVCISSGLKNFQKDLTDYAPDYMLLPPLYIENIWLKLTKTMEAQGRTDTFNTLVKTSNAMRKIGIDRRRTFFEKPLSLLGGRLTKVFAGIAPVDPAAVKFFDDIGVSILSCRGTPECGSIFSMALEPDEEEPGAGYLLPDFEARVFVEDEKGEGEILLRGEQIFAGYFKNDRASAEALDDDGWYHTGLIGRIAQTRVVVTGKIKHEIDLKIGRSVLPEEIESYLTALPCVKEAKVYAGKDARGAELHLCADLYLDDGQFEGMTRDEKVAIVKEKLDRLNAGLPAYKRVKVVKIKKKS